jgi:hypothetical protein
MTDQLPLSINAKRGLRWLQDWIAPFYIFLESEFSLSFLEADDMLDPSVYTVHSRINRQVFHNLIDSNEFEVQFRREGIIGIKSSGIGTLELTTLNR